MKVLKESKEELPVSFLTDFISQGWEKVGVLQASIEALKETYKGVGPVTDLIQDLVDAYLVCIGQLETHIEDKKYIEYPEDSNLGSNKLTEDIDIHITDDEVKVSDNSGEEVAIIPIEAEDQEKAGEVKETEEPKECEGPECENAPVVVDEPKVDSNNIVDFFVDFDDPDPREPRLTDKDLYDED